MKSLSQRVRLIILVLYIGTLLAISRYALGSWLPPTSQKGLWFYSGLATILLGNLLVTPFYTKPADAISYAVAALVGLLAVNVWNLRADTGFDQFLWLAVMLYLGLLLSAAVLSVVLKDSPGPGGQRVGKALFLITSSVGTPQYVFSAVYLFALVAFHRESRREYLSIGLAWALFVGLHPLELVADLVRRCWELWKVPGFGAVVGEVVAHETPSLVMVRRRRDAHVAFGDVLRVPSDDGSPTLAMVLDSVGYADGVWLRTLSMAIDNELRERLGRAGDAQSFSEATLLGAAVDMPDIGRIGDPAWGRRERLIGLVAADTDIFRLRIDLVRTDLGLEEGQLVEVQIGSRPVLYQILNGLTREEIVQQKNTRGYVRAEAKKIGSWHQERGRFEQVRWLPAPNAPVFLVEASAPVLTRAAVGHFPQTDYPVTLDVHSLVTHNAAILGILGAGKSYLALELVERMLGEGIKAICLDLTNQYAQELLPYRDADQQEEVTDLQGVGASGKDHVESNVEEGGSIRAFRAKLKEILRPFLDSSNRDRLLKIFNPTVFEVWRQDSKPYQGKASMASLTPTEVTRLFTEATLELLQEQGMTDGARCCLVFEEAHSLIPEWSAVASEGDRAATNGTAKAILQGRKYGLGCLIITQRTANVTKSILNQCNTVFALRVFDATGMEFLRNYIGEDYAGVLSTLEDRYAVVFGRASSCKGPVLIRLTDREDFLRVFRTVARGSAAGGVAP